MRLRFWSSFVSPAFLLVAITHCGKIQDAGQAVADKTVQGKDKASEGAQSLAEMADTWVNNLPYQQREEACREEKGRWTELVEVSACIDGLMTVTVDGDVQQQPCLGGGGGTADWQCVHTDRDGLYYYNDGPSVPAAMQRVSGVIADQADFFAYNRLFWPAGVNHDYCYHHGHATYDFERIDCDKQYFRDLSAVCAKPEHQSLDWFNDSACRKIAVSHYSAVRHAGEEPYDVQNSRVRYPEYTPLWKVFGLSEDPTNEEAMADIDNPSRRLDIF